MYPIPIRLMFVDMEKWVTSNAFATFWLRSAAAVLKTGLLVSKVVFTILRPYDRFYAGVFWVYWAWDM